MRLSGVICFTDVCVMVSMHGEDEPECLQALSTNSCKTISYAMRGGHSVVCMNGTFHNVSETLDISNSYGGSNNTEMYFLCVSCLLEQSNLTVYSSLDTNGHLSFVNFAIRDSSIQLGNVSVMFKNVTLGDVIVQDFEMTTTQVYFEGSFLSCSDTKMCGLTLTYSSAVKCFITHSHLNNFKLHLTVTDLMFTINNTIITQADIYVDVHSLAFLRIPTFIQFYNITSNKTSHLSNISPSSFRGKRSAQPSTPDSEIILLLTNPYLRISKCNFYQTHITIVANRGEFDQAYFWTMITDTKFILSQYEGDGGALTISSEVPNSKLLVSSCTFTNNTCIKGASSLKGYGGGMYIQSDSLEAEFKNCVFEDNKADDAGLHLYTSTGVTVSLTGCSFMYSVEPSNPIQETVVFIAGMTTHIEGHFKIYNSRPESYVGPISMFYIATVNDLNIAMTCPVWYRHSVQYSSSSTESDVMTGVRYECSPCSDNYYTTSAPDNVISYSAHGNTSVRDFHNRDQTDNICIKCPYGAICTGNKVMPRPNYWGYWSMGELEFLQCPAGYCCPGSGNNTCNAYNYCAGNKTGTLCAVVLKRASLSLFLLEHVPKTVSVEEINGFGCLLYSQP